MGVELLRLRGRQPVHPAAIPNRNPGKTAMNILKCILPAALLFLSLAAVATAGTPSERLPSSPATVRQNGEGLRVRLSFGGGEAILLLEDHPASRSFYAMLPLQLTLEDYNGTEKIGYLPEKLKTEGSPSRCDPEAGTFAYYAPWGNLAIFYRDFRPSDGLVPLGRIISGMQHLAGIPEDAPVHMEPVPRQDERR